MRTLDHKNILFDGKDILVIGFNKAVMISKQTKLKKQLPIFNKSFIIPMYMAPKLLKNLMI